MPGSVAGQPVGRNVGRPEVDRPADRTGAIANGGSAFRDFDRLHASDGREIIRCRGGIGSRRDQHAVFHERDIARTFDRTTAQTDVWEQAEPVFLLRIDAGDLPQDAIYIPMIETAQILAVDKIRRPGDPVRINAATDYDNRFSRILPAVLCDLPCAQLFAIRPGSLLGQSRCGQSNCEGRDGSAIHKDFPVFDCGARHYLYCECLARAKAQFEQDLSMALMRVVVRRNVLGFATPRRQGCARAA